MADRVILHCDCNSFFASVEMLKHPQWREVPMAVCGNEAMRHGIILAKNELAKRAGVKTAETIREAKRKCPDLVLAQPHYREYAAYSAAVHQIFTHYTDLVEPFGMDESWLDVTNSRMLFGDGVTVANELRKVVKAQTGLTISVGVSFNKVFAKLGSDYKKPDATTVIDRRNYHVMVDSLPVSDLLYVGSSALQTLHRLQIHTIGELAKANPALLQTKLGKLGLTLHAYANGEDDSPVARIGQDREMKSIGRGMTFRRDLATPEDVHLGILVLSEEVAAQLRLHRKKAAGVQLTLKDPNLKVITRQQLLSSPTQLAHELTAAAWALYQNAWRTSKPIRMLTVTAQGILPEEAATEQITFFGEAEHADVQKYGKLEHTLDAIRAKYGQEVIGAGAVLGNDLGIGTPSVAAQKKQFDAPPEEQS